MDLAHVEGFDWLATDFTMVSYEREFGHMSVQIMFKDMQPEAVGVIIDTLGNELSNQQVMLSIANGVPQSEKPEELVGITKPLRMHVHSEGWTMRDSDGRIWPIDHILADTTVTMKKTVSAAQTHRYTGGGKDYAIATAGAQIGELPGTFVMVRNEDDTTSVYLTFGKPGQAQPA